MKSGLSFFFLVLIFLLSVGAVSANTGVTLDQATYLYTNIAQIQIGQTMTFSSVTVGSSTITLGSSMPSYLTGVPYSYDSLSGITTLTPNAGATTMYYSETPIAGIFYIPSVVGGYLSSIPTYNPLNEALTLQIASSGASQVSVYSSAFPESSHTITGASASSLGVNTIIVNAVGNTTIIISFTSGGPIGGPGGTPIGNGTVYPIKWTNVSTPIGNFSFPTPQVPDLTQIPWYAAIGAIAIILIFGAAFVGNRKKNPRRRMAKSLKAGHKRRHH
jgi:hypothetical protein